MMLQPSEAMIKRTTLRMTRDDRAALEREAARQGRAMSDLARDAIRAYLLLKREVFNGERN